MSIMKDQNLALTGRRKINWMRDFMPALDGIETRFEQKQPFVGLRVAVSVHLETKTASLGYVPAEGGAEVCPAGSNPLPAQNDVTAGLAGMGVEISGIHGTMGEEHENLLIETPKFKPHLIVDDGGDLIHLLGGKYTDLGEYLIGGYEETVTGILRLRAREREDILSCLMMAVNDAKAEHYHDNECGTGQSVWDAIVHATNPVVAGKTAMVVRYGWRGEGVAMWAAGVGVSVIATEVGPFKTLDATMNGLRVMPMDGAARYDDTFVIVTDCKDVTTPKYFAVTKHNAILTDAGHFDYEVDVAGLAAMATKQELRRDNIEGSILPNDRALNVIGKGRLINLAAGNGHPVETMDMSSSAQALVLERLVKYRDGLEKKIYQVPAEIGDAIGRVKLAAVGPSIDALTPEREEYLNGWKV